MPAHSHANEQMSTVLDGRMRFTIDGEDIIAEAGQTVTIPPFSKHGVEALEDCHMLEVFSPVRQDWIDGTDQYLRKP
ncbi:Cupin domain protein [compost metagenome]